MAVDWEQLEREAELGKWVLVYLNRLELRKQEDREYVDKVKRVGRELFDSVGGRAKGQAA